MLARVLDYKGVLLMHVLNEGFRSSDYDEVTVRERDAWDLALASPRHENTLPSFLIGKLPSDGRDSIKDPALDLVDLQCDTSFLDWRGCRRKWRRSRDDWSLQEKLLETSWRLVHNGECLHKMRAPAESFWSIAVPHMFQMIELNAIDLIYGSSIRISSITRTHFIVIILATIYKSICNGEYLLQR